MDAIRDYNPEIDDHNPELDEVLVRHTAKYALDRENGVPSKLNEELGPFLYENEQIVSAAIVFENRVYVMDRPNRHHNILHKLALENAVQLPVVGLQGFWTNRNRYVGRILAGQIALKSMQIKKLNWAPELYTEDLW